MPDNAFSQMEAVWLRPDVRGQVIDLHEACGLIVAVVTAPALLMPADWTPQLLDRGEEDWMDSPAAAEAMHAAIGYWSHIDDQLDAKEPIPLPPDCGLEDGQGNSALDGFAEGFLRGLEWLSPTWEATGARDREPLSLILEFTQGSLVFLCGNPAVRQEMRRGHPRLPKDPEELLALLPRVLCELGRIGRELNPDAVPVDSEF